MIKKESIRSKPRDIFKGKIYAAAAGCGRLNLIDFVPILKQFDESE
jgi:hypothetical protein